MSNVNFLGSQSGRFLGEDNEVINIADKISAMANGLVTVAKAKSVSCVIPSGGNVPEAGIDISEGMVLSIKNDGWTAAPMTFLVSDALDGTYVTLYDDDGAEVSMVVVAGKTQAVITNALALASAKFIKPRSGNDAGVVAQGADRALTFSLKG